MQDFGPGGFSASGLLLTNNDLPEKRHKTVLKAVYNIFFRGGGGGGGPKAELHKIVEPN